MKIGIIGLGWYGSHLAERLSPKHQVHGTKTDWAARSMDGSIAAYPLRLDAQLHTDDAEAIFDADCMVVNIPPARKGDETAPYYAAQMNALLGAINPARTSHLIFVSSTGVFGDHQARVDEDVNPEPTTSGGKALHDAEQYFIAHFSGRVSVIRPAGLVGEDRHPAKYLAGRSGIAGGQHPVNLVHREDLIRLTEVLIENDFGYSTFHAIARDHPAKSAYYSAAANAFGLEAPGFDPDDDSPGKFVDGEKTKLRTGVAFKYENPYDMF